MGIDFTFRFGFAENNSKKIAGCDTRTSNPAIAELRKVQHDNFAPYDSLMFHLATSRYRTLSLSPVAPCDSKSPILLHKIALPAPFPAVGADGSGFSNPDISDPFGMRRDIVPKVVDCLLTAYNKHLGDKVVAPDHKFNRLLKKTPFRNTATAQLSVRLQSTPGLQRTFHRRRTSVPAG